MAFGISAVALAGLVLVATHGHDDGDKATPAASSHPGGAGLTRGPDTTVPDITPTPTVTTPSTPKPPPVVKRGRTNVVVFNNTNVKGLAGLTATRAQRAGWNIVTTDNWHGSVDASTVYFGPRMRAAAQLLARDLGIGRVKPSFSPMNPQQLTVILTSDYADR
jgi:hypothetical protein